MRVLGNICWVLFGGGLLSVVWAIYGIVCCLTILGIPFGIQCFKLATFILWPFGRQIYYANNTETFIGNICWIFLCGWKLAIASLVIGLIWCASIIGIPFGLQCFKMARLALLPFGARVL